jgi:D-glycero-D-manno-heptose 1,7-bisphosphate phosphatase
MGRSAVFLDRDGVLNAAVVVGGLPHSPRTASEVVTMPDAPDACRSLRLAGFMLVVVTNQPDLARGTTNLVDVDAINRSVRRTVTVDDLRMCPHDDADDCQCRKPRPGLLLDAAADHGIDLLQSWMIGDRWRDVDAGRAAGCRTIFIDRGYGEPPPNTPTRVARSLASAACFIIGERLKEAS